MNLCYLASCHSLLYVAITPLARRTQDRSGNQHHRLGKSQVCFAVPSIGLAHAYMVTPIDDLNICIASVSLVRGEEVDVSLRRVKIGHQQTGRLQPELGRKLGGSTYKLRRFCKQLRQSRFGNASELSSTITTQPPFKTQNNNQESDFNNNHSNKKHHCNSTTSSG